MRVPLGEQIEAVSDCLVAAQRAGLEEETLRAASAAIRTLMWLKDNVTEIREFAALERSEEVQAIKRVFPGARIARVRRV